ncbi:ABC transporter substrate-binding protein [Brevibacillus sp. H7]|uniref:ABC transporter substrate-binding protein n=1 Tax=Brevibacillus sp. H7 TaxID=3349138 RepID=UPI00381265BA
MSKVRFEKKSRFTLLAFCMSVALFIFPFFTIGAAQAAEEPVTLRVGWTAEPDSLSPFISNRIVTFELHLLLYDTLIAYDNDVKPVGRLAKEWKVSDDHLTWTFKLAEGVKWHDGQPFTSEDVKFTYESLMKAQTGMYADFLKGITAIETPDPLTVVIKTEKPKANMLQVTAPILPKHIWSSVKFEDLKTWPNDKPIGTGAFKFVEWKKGEYVKLEANKDYFLGAPKIEQLIFPLYANNDTMVQSLKIGEIDGAININPNQVKLLQSEKNIQVVSNPGNHFTDLAINVWKDPNSKGNPLLLMKEVRKAMEYAIHKQQVIDVAYSGQARIGTTLVPSVFANWHYEPQGEEMRSYNPEKAKQLLEAAGFSDRDGDGIREDAKGKKLEFRLFLRGETAEEVKAGQMISGMFKEVGIGTKVETMDDGLLTDKIYDNADFDLFIWGWGTDVDPTTILSVVSTDQIGNLSETYYSNPQYDKMLIEQGTIVDQAAREQMIKDMQKMVYEDVPYIILLEDHGMQAVRTDKWDGWKPIGGALFQGYNHYNYLSVSPKSTPASNPSASETPASNAAPAASQTAQQSSGQSGLIWAGLAIVAMAVIGVLIARKRKTIDDFDQK